MAGEGRQRSERTDLVADAAIEVLSRLGSRGLTHRAVDRAAGLAEGSTSYYCRTRRALVELIVARMAARSMDDARRHQAQLDADPPGDATAAVAALVGLVDDLARRDAAMRARYHLLLSLDDDDPLRGVLSDGSPVRASGRDRLRDLLVGLGVTTATAAARTDELMDLVDAAVFLRVVMGAPPARVRALVERQVRAVMPD